VCHRRTTHAPLPRMLQSNVGSCCGYYFQNRLNRLRQVPSEAPEPAICTCNIGDKVHTCRCCNVREAHSRQQQHATAQTDLFALGAVALAHAGAHAPPLALHAGQSPCRCSQETLVGCQCPRAPRLQAGCPGQSALPGPPRPRLPATIADQLASRAQVQMHHTVHRYRAVPETSVHTGRGDAAPAGCASCDPPAAAKGWTVRRRWKSCRRTPAQGWPGVNGWSCPGCPAGCAVRPRLRCRDACCDCRWRSATLACPATRASV
jgi:hypothetical protein